MARQNNGDALARLIRAAADDPAPVLLKIGSLTCWVVVSLAAALPPAPVGGGRDWWLPLFLLVACFFGGVGAMWASIWVRADADQRRPTGQILLAIAVVNLLAAVALGGFDRQIVHHIVDAML